MRKLIGEEKNEVKIGFWKKLMGNFYPTYRFKSVETIPYSLIEKNNIKLILLDMDNTIIDRKENYSKEMKEWADRMIRNDVTLYILSNSPFGKLVKKIATELGMKYYYSARKPSLKGFKYIINNEKVALDQCLMIGDQLFTDVWGGNRFGIKTVLVRPINAKERIHTKVKRPFEKMVLKHYLKKEGDRNS